MFTGRVGIKALLVGSAARSGTGYTLPVEPQSKCLGLWFGAVGRIVGLDAVRVNHLSWP
jgi:hypothetical protein